jgi:hypothetical protein
MRLAYIVPAHQNPSQVERLLRRLASDGATFVVHVDLRAGEEVFDRTRRLTSDLDVRFVDRHVCFWGGFGFVAAALKGIDALVRGSIPFDYAILLSGQDYPLRSPQGIETFFAQSEGRSYMTHRRLPYSAWDPRGGFDRIEKWHLVSRHALHLRLLWKRRIPGHLTPFGGEAWWNFSRPVAEYVHEFVAGNRRYVRFFEHVLHPSELFFQTIVMNSPHAEHVVDDHLRYIDWGRDLSRPKSLGVDDLERIVTSGKLFARKFDAGVDSAILDRLDEHIDREALAPFS